MPPSQSILVHPPSASTTTSLLDSRLRDSGSSSGSNGSLLVGGGLQQRNSNTSIASDRGGAPPTRKVPLKASSFSPAIARRLAHDSAPILPDRMRDHRGGNIGNSSNASSTSTTTTTGPASVSASTPKRRFSHFRAAEKGKGDILPTHTAHSIPEKSSNLPIIRSRTKSQGSFASSNSSGKLFPSPMSAAEPMQDRSRSLRSRRNKSIQQLQQQQHSYNDDCNASDRSMSHEQHGTTNSKNSWSDESDAGSNNGYHHAQHNNHTHYSQHQQQHKQHPMKHHRDPSYLLGCGGGGGSGNNRDKKYYGNNQNTLWLNMKPVQFITVMLLLAVTCFVAGSYHKVLSTTEILKEVKHEESLLLLHLQRVEQASLQLHENLSRLNDRSLSSNGNSNSNSNTNNHENAQQQQQAPNNGSNTVQVDSDLIRIQTEKLREMEAELDHEVRALQKKIQTSARRAIVENYGEGAVQVYLDLYNPEDEEEDDNEEGSSSNEASDSADASSMHGKNRIAIRLWYDTPHSAWTFLNQVSTGQWNGAVFDWDPTTTGGRSILARSTNAGLGHDSDGKSKAQQKGEAVAATAKLEPELHFVEQSQRGHERYTIGLTDSGILINLQDNRDFYKHEACVGTIINGFDVLHRVIRQAQRGEHPVRIKRALVSHLTTRPEKMS